MIHSEVIATIARRLPHRTRRDVTEIIELMVELWSDELLRGRTVTIPDIGQLKLEIQDIQTGGILKQYGQRRRVYGRFTLTTPFKAQIEEIKYE